MSAVVRIALSDFHCPDCVATLCDVILPKTPGVQRTERTADELLVTLDETVLSEADLLAKLSEGGLIK